MPLLPLPGGHIILFACWLSFLINHETFFCLSLAAIPPTLQLIEFFIVMFYPIWSFNFYGLASTVDSIGKIFVIGIEHDHILNWFLFRSTFLHRKNGTIQTILL